MRFCNLDFATVGPTKSKSDRIESATTLAGRPLWLVIQRWIMGTALFALAVRMALDSRK